MNSKEIKGNIDFLFECEQCREVWSENLLDLIERCTSEELLNLLEYIQNKVKKSSPKNSPDFLIN